MAISLNLEKALWQDTIGKLEVRSEKLEMVVAAHKL